MTRRVLAFILVLGLAPGVTGALLEDSAHCGHACCHGQDFCYRGDSHEHGTAGHGDHDEPAALSITAIAPPSMSCVETCGVLPDLRPKTESHTRTRTVAVVHDAKPAPPAPVLVADDGHVVDPAAPRGPPPVTHHVHFN